MYYQILKYFNDQLDLSNLMDQIIDLKESKNESIDPDKIKNILASYYMKIHSQNLSKQKKSDLSNRILKMIFIS